MTNCKEQSLKNITWDEIKQEGSEHYRVGDIQLIDLLRDIKPHPDLSVLDVMALVCNMKYSFRQLTKGKNESDCNKTIHYTKMVKWGVK